MLLNKINENKNTLQQLNKKPRKQTNRYSVKTLLFRSLNIEDCFVGLHSSFLDNKLGTYSIEKFIEILKKKKLTYHIRTITNNDGKEKKNIYFQMFKPTNISIRLSDEELKSYVQHYTYQTKNKLGKNWKRNINPSWRKILNICLKDSNFRDAYERTSSYLECIYLYDHDVEEKNKKSDPFKNIIEQDNYQSLDNIGISHKYIEYPLNKNATNFNELFQYQEMTSNFQPNFKANSCYFNLIIDTFKEPIEKVVEHGRRRYKDLTVESLSNILGVFNKDQDLGLSIRSSIKFFEKYHLSLFVVDIYDNLIFKYMTI